MFLRLVKWSGVLYQELIVIYMVATFPRATKGCHYFEPHSSREYRAYVTVL
jgi:hypothetical protein